MVEGESWEELDTAQITHGAPSLRWLVWPKIDKDSLETLSIECSRIIVNPKSSLFGYKGIQIPQGALQDVQLDVCAVKDVDAKTWAVSVFMGRYTPSITSGSDELTIAEKFRLAFEERDNRLAPKRAKNARQHQRRADKEFLMTSTRAKSIALAALASKSLTRS